MNSYRTSLIILIWITFSSSLFGNSLWQSNGFGERLFVDHRGRSIGDSVTIILQETSAASHLANTKLDNATDVSVGPGTGMLSFGKDPSVASAVGEKDTFQGKGSTDRSSSLSGKISATITDVYPNGEMEIRGKKEMLINNETQVMEISGRIRPENISLDNTIESSSIANAKIIYTGTGVVNNVQAPGLLAQFFGWLF